MNQSQAIIESLVEAKLRPGLITTHAKQRGVVFQTGKSVVVPFIRNTESSKQFGISKTQFQINIEPKGRYMTFDEMPDSDPLPGWERGLVQFKSPLVLPFNTTNQFGYDDNSWKAQLNRVYGKKGKPLSRAIRKDGYDGIVTVWQGSTREIIDLTMIN